MRSLSEEHDNDDILLTPDDVEVLCKIPKSTQASMRHRREIPFILIAKRTPRYRRSEIAAWLSERAIAAERPESRGPKR